MSVPLWPLLGRIPHLTMMLAGTLPAHLPLR